MHQKNRSYLTIALSVLLISLIALSGYLYYLTVVKDTAIQVLEAEKQTLITENATRLTQLDEANASLTVLQEAFDLTTEELDELEDDYRKEKRKNDEFQDQIEELAGTVGTLDKLSKTDQELLQKYSKVYFLNENYIPSQVSQIDNSYILAGRNAQFFHGDALPFLENMLDDAKDDDIDLKIVSAYRSFDTQTELKGAYTTQYGTGANTFSADQGYSEHQLGTTVDLTTPSVGGTYTSFAQTDAYAWLKKNAHKYGFTLSYPEENGFYVFEPWHWRFVGEDLADDLRDEGAHFYDWDQRKIDQYLIKIFD